MVQKAISIKGGESFENPLYKIVFPIAVGVLPGDFVGGIFSNFELFEGLANPMNSEGLSSPPQGKVLLAQYLSQFQCK